MKCMENQYVDSFSYTEGYEKQSQLHAHEINRANLTSDGRKIMNEIHQIVSEDDYGEKNEKLN